MSDLLTRIRDATEGSRELSDEVLRAFPGCEMLVHEKPRPDPTRSIDDAVALLPEGKDWCLKVAVQTAPDMLCVAEAITARHADVEGYGPGYQIKFEECKTPALAICALALALSGCGRSGNGNTL